VHYPPPAKHVSDLCRQGHLWPRLRDSPDFKTLTWKADDTCTLKILKTNGTFMLNSIWWKTHAKEWEKIIVYPATGLLDLHCQS
jgi:hypothetical protein